VSETRTAGGSGSAIAGALRYLQDLGWESVYRDESRPGAPAVAGGAPAASRVSAAPDSALALPAAPSSATPTAIAPPRTATPDQGHAVAAVAAERAGLLAQVAADASACVRCELSRGRTHVVFGSGDPDADLMVIGEGPGFHEDRQGLPFVGPAGELLTRILLAIERTRDQVYIANIVKCRPPQTRDPRPAEVAACRPYLESQIALVRPRVIVALGRVAGQTLLGNDFPVGRLRGTWWEVAGVPVRVTYHPAALLRDSGLKRPTWDDMKIVRDRLRGQESAV
jgi:DNA polymerase